MAYTKVTLDEPLILKSVAFNKLKHSVITRDGNLVVNLAKCYKSEKSCLFFPAMAFIANNSSISKNALELIRPL